MSLTLTLVHCVCFPFRPCLFVHGLTPFISNLCKKLQYGHARYCEVTDVLSGAWCHTPTSAGAKTIVCHTCTEMLEVISSTATASSATGVEGSASIEVMLRELKVQKCFPGQYEGGSSGGGSVFRKETSNSSDDPSLLSEPFHFTKAKAVPAKGKASGVSAMGGRAASSSSTVDTTTSATINHKAKGPISTSKHGYRRWNDEETTVLRAAVRVHGDDAEAIKNDPKFAEALQYRNAEAIWNKILREALLPSMNNSAENSVVDSNERRDKEAEDEEEAEFEGELQQQKQNEEKKDNTPFDSQPENDHSSEDQKEEAAEIIAQESIAMEVETELDTEEDGTVRSGDAGAVDTIVTGDASTDAAGNPASTEVDNELQADLSAEVNSAASLNTEGEDNEKEDEEVSRASTPAPQRAARSRGRAAAASSAESLCEDTSTIASAPVSASTSRSTLRLSTNPTPTSEAPATAEKAKMGKGKGKYVRIPKTKDSAGKASDKPTEEPNTTAASAAPAAATATAVGEGGEVEVGAEDIDEEEAIAEAPRMVATRTSRRAVEEQNAQQLLSTRSGKKLFLSGNDLLPSFH